MRIYKTGHSIADTVADAFIKGCKGWRECDLGYGILRGNDQVFKNSDSWFEIDRGFWGANHFDGYYRISYKGTQAKWHENIPKQDIEFELEDWKSDGSYILVCPPSLAVVNFFNVLDWAEGSEFPYPESSRYEEYKIRYKKDESAIDWDKIKGVITFNSSIGWQALQRGIPCISDPEHSIVGSYYTHELRKLGLDYTFENIKTIPREPLFRAMAAHQFKLKDISEGKAWPILQHYLTRFSSGGIQESKLPPKSLPIQ